MVHGRVEIGDALSQLEAGHAKEKCGIEPIVSETVTAMHRQRYGILIDSEPAIETESNFDRLAASDGFKVDLLLFCVRAISVDAKAISNQKADYRIFDIAKKPYRKAQAERCATLHYVRVCAGGVEQLGADNFSAAVTVPV